MILKQTCHFIQNEFANGFGIPEICALMNNASRMEYQRLQDVNAYMAAGGNFQFTNNNYSQFIESLTNINGPNNGRATYYQMCTEFGNFRSNDQGVNIFGSTVPVK